MAFNLFKRNSNQEPSSGEYGPEETPPATRTYPRAGNETTGLTRPSGVGPGPLAGVGDRILVGDLALRTDLYTALGAPAAKLRPIWDRIADSARRAPKAARKNIAEFGWAAAVGLYLQDTTDPTPINELSALGGGSPPPSWR